MTVSVPPVATTSRATALLGAMSTTSRTSSAPNTSARRALKRPPCMHVSCRCCRGVYHDKGMISTVAPLVFHVYYTLGVLQARLVKPTKDGTLGLQYARRNRVTIKHARGIGPATTPHGALDVPRHRGPDVRGEIPSGHRRRIRIISRLLGSTGCSKRGGGSTSPPLGGGHEVPTPRPVNKSQSAPPDEVPARRAPLDAEGAGSGHGGPLLLSRRNPPHPRHRNAVLRLPHFDWRLPLLLRSPLSTVRHRSML